MTNDQLTVREALIQDLEFAVALAGKLYPERAEAISLRLSEYRAALSAQHPDDAAVDRFAAAMKAKLAASRAKGRYGWDDSVVCPINYLQSLLAGHMAKGDPVDVGNFAMMLFNRGAPTADPMTAKPWVDAAIAAINAEQPSAEPVASPAPTAQDRDAALREAVANLVKVKGRHHTEQAYQRLVEVFDTSEQSKAKE